MWRYGSVVARERTGSIVRRVVVGCRFDTKIMVIDVLHVVTYAITPPGKEANCK